MFFSAFSTPFFPLLQPYFSHQFVKHLLQICIFLNPEKNGLEQNPGGSEFSKGLKFVDKFRYSNSLLPQRYQVQFTLQDVNQTFFLLLDFHESKS